MTKVSEKGVVQIIHGRRAGDLPRWTLSAMKCLANWPKPFQALMGTEGGMPSYEGFEVDVFNVVKEYFISLTCPLTTFELFDVFVSAFIKAEAISVQRPIRNSALRNFSVTPMPYLETDLDASKPSSTSTPSGYYSASESCHNYGHMLTTNERVAHIRQTLQVMPPHQNDRLKSTYSGVSLNAKMSPTAIMKSFLPPNTCFETAFMNENPITRIVPQKGNDVLHFGQRYRPHCQVPLSSTASVVSSMSGWDSRSIATQTSDEEGESNRRFARSRQPKWRRNARQRKSIAVMETNQETLELTNRFRSNSYSTSALPPKAFKSAFSGRSVDNLLESPTETDRQFLMKYQQIGDINELSGQRRYSMMSLPSDRKMSPPDNVILSKTVRKEKRRQREKKEKSIHHESPVSSTQSSSSLASCRERFRTSSHYYSHLAVQTPMHICGENAPIPYMDEGMQNARAEPFKDDDGLLTLEGRRSAINSFQLLGLLLPPESRRQLQLLLKFMKRVCAKEGLKLTASPRKTTRDVVLETFSEAILRPQNDLANYDEELCRKIVCFFVENYDEIWTPPVVLRKEVEEKVYQSLVSKRIEAGEDPYPITFCKRVPSKVYEKEKISGVQAAMLDLLEHIINDKKMGTREKRKKLKRFKLSYPEVYASRFPTTDAEPEYMRNSGAFSSSMPSLSKLRSVMRI